jgi:hypothetical protein
MPRDCFMLAEVLPEEMLNKRFGIVIRGASAGFYRVQLTDLEVSEEYCVSGHGAVVRELLTNSPKVMGIMVRCLSASGDPRACAALLEDEFRVRGPAGLPVISDRQWRKIEEID